MRMTTRLIAMLLIVGGAAQAVAQTEPRTMSKMINGHVYILAWFQDGTAGSYSAYGSVSIVHSAACTNHAPTVVTNYITVTQECHRAHIETRNIWLGDGKIVTNDAGDVKRVEK